MEFLAQMSRDALGFFAEKRLVVFGAGYVGTAVVAEALRRGARVTALTRNPEKAARLAEAGARSVVADLADEAWHPEIEGADWVVNCVSSGGGGAAAYQRSYVEGMHSIAAWLRAAGGAQTFLYTSSTSVYPQSEGIVDEAVSTEAATGTGVILLKAEAGVKQAVEDRLCRRGRVLRLAGIYGPGRHHVLDQLRSGVRPLPGKGDHRLNLVYREDIVSAIFAALIAAEETAASAYEVFNVVDDRPVRKSELVEWLAARLGMVFPGFSGKAVPGRRADPPDRVVSNAKIRTQLGWTPRFADFRAGYEAILGA